MDLSMQGVGWLLMSLVYVAAVLVFAAGAASGANWMWRRLTAWRWPAKPGWYWRRVHRLRRR